VRICAVIVLAGLLATGITWRKLANDRLVLDVGTQRSQIETLQKEIRQLSGQVEAESAYPRVAKWAREQRGWLALPGHSARLILDLETLTPGGRREVELLRGTSHE
jgi:hypothetical protein